MKVAQAFEQAQPCADNASLGLGFDRSAAQQYLELLGKDAGSAWFRTLPRSRERQGLDSGWINQQIKAGRNVYLVTGDADQATSKRGMVQDDDITACRALFVEWDDKETPIEEQAQRWQALGLPEPTITVSSGGKSAHLYWVLDQPMAPAQWKPIQAALIDHCNGDKACKNPSRLMRLPGSVYFDKKTGEATGRCQILSSTGTRYTAAEIQDCIPAPAPRATKKPKPARGGDAELAQLLPKSLEQLARDGSPEGSRNGDAFKLAASALACAEAASAAGLTLDGTPEDLVLAFAARCSPPLEESEALKCLSSAAGQPRNVDPGWSDRLKYHLRDGKRTTQARPKDHPVERSAAVAAGAKGIDAVLAAVGTGWRESTRTGLKTGDLSGLLKALDGRLGFDELAMGPAVDGVPLKDWEVSLLHAQLSEGGWKIGKDDAVAGLLLAARRHSFHPVRQYLKRVEADQSIEAFNLDDVAPRFFRAHSRLHQTMVRKWLIGAVARAMEPGCQMDYCLVLQSDTQGLGKSTSFRELASPEWFCSTFPDDEKDQTLNIHSSWIFELAELEAVTGSKAAGKLKNQITTAIDVFRAPYGQRPERHARSGVFCGTVNKQTFLKDDTGNRRFWVVPIEGTEKLDREGLAAARDGIWKAAVLAWRAGERPMLPIDLSEASEQQNEDHRETDSWLPLVAQYLDRCQQEEQVPVAVKNVLGFIGLSADRQSPRQARRAREAAESLGWRHRTRRRPDGTRATGLWPLSTETTQTTTQATQATTQAKSSDAKGSAPLSIEATQKTPNLAKKRMEEQEEAAGEKKQGKREVFWVASIDRDPKPSDAKGSEEIPWVVASVDRAVPSVVSVVSSSPTIPGLDLPSGPIGSGADVMIDGDDPAWSQRVA